MHPSPNNIIPSKTNNIKSREPNDQNKLTHKTNETPPPETKYI